MSESHATILDLQRSLDMMTADRDKHKIICNGFARYIATEVLKVGDAALEPTIEMLIEKAAAQYDETALTQTARRLRGK